MVSTWPATLKLIGQVLPQSGAALKMAMRYAEPRERSAELDRARSEALLDPLTGILNRKGFDESLQALIAQPAAAGPSHCLVMLATPTTSRRSTRHGHVMGAIA